MRENAAETVRKCGNGKKKAVIAIGYGNSIKCRPQQAAERKMYMRKPGESVYCLSFWRNKFQGKSGDEPYFDVVEDGISAGKVMRIYVDAKRFPT